MKHHSTESIERDNEFKRILARASLETNQVLIYSPDKVDSLADQLEQAFGIQLAKKLKKDRHIHANNVDYFLEATKTKSGFTRGNIFMPWASQHTWQSLLKDPRGVNTFFIPWNGPEALKFPGGKDELVLYLRENPDSIEI